MQQIDSVAARDEEAAKEGDWPIQIAKGCTQKADAAQRSEDHSGPMLLHGSGGIALGVPAKGVEHGHQKEKSEAVWAESTESLQEGIAREEEIAEKENAENEEIVTEPETAEEKEDHSASRFPDPDR